METKLATIELRVENLEASRDAHEREDERMHRYVTHMIEDTNAKLASLERTGVRFETDLTHRTLTDTGTQTTIKSINDRLFRLEIAFATVLGGLAVSTWLINRAADNILHLLMK